MKSYMGLIPKYLLNQKKRTLLTLIGIMLSVAMLAVPGIIQLSSKHNSRLLTEERHGRYHTIIDGLEQDKLNVVKNHVSVNMAGEISVLGTHQLADSKHTINVIYCDNNAIDICKDVPLLNINLSKGIFPKEASEIALEEWIIEEMQPKPSLGDNVTLTLNHGNADGSSDTFSAEFTLVGILENAYYTEFYGKSRALVSKEAIQNYLPQEEDQLYSVALLFDKGLPITDTAEKLQKDLGTGTLRYNDNLVWLEEGNEENYDWIAVLVYIIIIITTIITLNNVFQISMYERIRQFGLLRAVGTSPRQITKIILGEAIFLCMIAIPFGIGLSIGLTYLLMHTFSLFQETGFNNIVISSFTLIFAAVMCFFAVIIAALRPAMAAGKITPLEAIKSIDVVVKDKIINKNLISRLFGSIHGKLAYQNLNRQKKRFLTTIVTMCIGVITFIVCSYFASSAIPAKMMGYTFVGDYMIRVNEVEDSDYPVDEAAKHIKEVNEVSEVYTTKLNYDKVLYNEDDINPKYKEFALKEYDDYFEQDEETGRISCFSSVVGYSENILKMAEPLLIDGEVDIDRMSQVPEVLYVNNTTYQGAKRIRPSKHMAGDYIYVRFASLNRSTDEFTYGEVQKFKIAGVLDQIPVLGYFGQEDGIIILHENMYNQYVNPFFTQFDIKVNPDADIDKVEDDLRDINDKVKGRGLMSLKEEIEYQEKSINQIMIMAYVLVAMVTLIGIFSILNINNTNLILRVREFGMMKAVGMTNKELKRMIIYEGFITGLISAFWGVIIGNGLSYVLYLLSKNGAIPFLQWTVPWMSIAVAFIGCILLGTFTSLIPLRRVTSINIIEAIRTIE